MLVCTATAAPSRSSNSQSSRSHGDQNQSSRRRVLALPLILPLLGLRPSPASAAPVVRNKEVDNASSPFIQDLLRKTEEQAEQRKADRLKDYYRRNYQDYFNFMDGSNMNNSGIDKKTQAEIKAWLEENGVKPRGGK